jgi:predicted nucleotidyltransferase
VTLPPALGPEFDPDLVAAVARRLQAIREQDRVVILLAIESGSRAWGFPSSDSDHDCRFIYVRSRDGYLSLFPPRDVIETPLDAMLDVGGWDLAKALRLLLKGNAVVIEWLMSPFVYAGDADFRSECLSLAHQVVRAEAVAHHYLHLGERQRRTYFSDLRAIPLKKLFYALRPAVALRWLRLHPGRAIVPMHLPTLVAESDLAEEVRSIIADLVARKRVTRELGRGPLPRPLSTLIDDEFTRARDEWPRRAERPAAGAVAASDALLRRWVTN